MFPVVFLVTLAALAARASYVPFKEPTDEGVVGGGNTKIEDHPYQLALELNNRFKCGASLVKPNVALTAAHCTVRAATNRLRVRAGSAYNGKGGELANVRNKCEHPKYRYMDYDVSVLLLDRSFKLSANIQTIALQPVGVEVPEGTIATLTGWGLLKHNGQPPSILQRVEIQKVSQQKCSAAYKPLGLPVTERMECYGYAGGKGGCNGDSGGPIVVNGKQTGIVSWTKMGACAESGYPTVFAKISSREVADHIQKCTTNF